MYFSKFLKIFLVDEHNLQKRRTYYWHNFRNMRALLAAYYPFFASTIYQQDVQNTGGPRTLSARTTEHYSAH